MNKLWSLFYDRSIDHHIYLSIYNNNKTHEPIKIGLSHHYTLYTITIRYEDTEIYYYTLILELDFRCCCSSLYFNILNILDTIYSWLLGYDTLYSSILLNILGLYDSSLSNLVLILVFNVSMISLCTILFTSFLCPNYKNPITIPPLHSSNHLSCF